eukprot:SM000301S11759  [mRNA]  locus=s301:14049:17171:+ [translate_table: standard]
MPPNPPPPPRGSDPTLAEVRQALAESAECRERRIQQLFAVFDADQSGSLDHTQIERGFRSLSLPSDYKYARELLEVCDRNRDGVCDFEEFRRYMDMKELELYQLFQEIDIESDGQVTDRELQVALGKAGINIKDEQLAQFVEHVDKDRNGIITFGEWRDFLLLYPHKATLASVYRYWEKMLHVDIGEQAIIPEGISRNHHEAWRYLLAGGVAGAVSRTATAPLDRLKVLLQVQTSSGPAAYQGVVKGLQQIYAHGGVQGFFRGNGINIFKVAPESAIKFYAYEIMKKVVVGKEPDSAQIGPAGRLVSGGVAGAIAQTVVYPIDLVKTRLQTYATAPGHPPPSLLGLSKSILMQEGPRAFYRGLTPSLLGMIPYAGLDLAAYESLKDFSRHFLAAGDEPGPVIQLACGTLSGAFGATVVYPLQLVRTRLQAQCQSSAEKYTGMLDVFHQTWRHEGPTGFYKGLLPNMLKVAPAASITYIVYESMKERLALP